MKLNAKQRQLSHLEETHNSFQWFDIHFINPQIHRMKSKVKPEYSLIVKFIQCKLQVMGIFFILSTCSELLGSILWRNFCDTSRPFVYFCTEVLTCNHPG